MIKKLLEFHTIAAVAIAGIIILITAENNEIRAYSHAPYLPELKLVFYIIIVTFLAVVLLSVIESKKG